MKFTVIILIVLFAVLFFLRPEPSSHPVVAISPPWDIENLADGHIAVFGLSLGISRFSDLQLQLGDQYELAIMEANDKAASLELYAYRYQTSSVTGKLVAVANADAAQLAEFKARATEVKMLQTGSRQYRLSADDLVLAASLSIRSLIFVPSVNLDEAVIYQRFGEPVSVIELNEQQRHLLYPQQGLAILFDKKGKEVIHYVMPEHFSELLELLKRS